MVNEKKSNPMRDKIILGGAVILFVSGITLSFQDMTGPATVTYGAAVLCLIFCSLDKFKEFSGLGVSAKLHSLSERANQTEESVETLLALKTPSIESDSEKINIRELTKELGFRHEAEPAIDRIILALREGAFDNLLSLHSIAKVSRHSTTTIRRIIDLLYEQNYIRKAYSKSGELWTLTGKGKLIENLKLED